MSERGPTANWRNLSEASDSCHSPEQCISAMMGETRRSILSICLSLCASGDVEIRPDSWPERRTNGLSESMRSREAC